MDEPFTGGCACGAIRYRITAEPVGMNDCQCRQCQRESGTGHASHLTFPRSGVSVEGTASIWNMVGDQGTRKARAFCPTCGSPVYMTFPDLPDYFVVRAGSLDDPKRYRPQLISWGAAAQPWDHVDPALPKFERMPPS
jgi:hypothetical protein